jgi:hypothetical protein
MSKFEGAYGEELMFELCPSRPIPTLMQFHRLLFTNPQYVLVITPSP